MFLIPTPTHENPHRISSSQKLMIIKFSYHYINPPKKINTVSLPHPNCPPKKNPSFDQPVLQLSGCSLATLADAFLLHARFRRALLTHWETYLSRIFSRQLAMQSTISLAKSLNSGACISTCYRNNQSLKNQSDLELK